ncbi:MAG TPA: hypothetical protein PK504_12875 [Ferruginibacter sp.]|nr:hypothetical protein [Ferruginibacter sp.]HRE64843.1 hypothetical protein [Ferruginibacter sp.]
MKFNQTLQNIVTKWGLLIAIIFAIAILALQGCEKIKEDIYKNYFEDNVLDRDFKVDYATTETTNITSQFEGWIFRLKKATYTNGPMTATKNGALYTGTWVITENYGKLTININQPIAPTGFDYLNKSWKFTEKNLPVIKFAPWGIVSSQILHMRRL